MQQKKPTSSDAMTGKRQRGYSKPELLAVAAQLFAKKGYAASTLDELAVTLGVSKATIYHYVESKEALLLDINTTLLDIIEKQLDPIGKSHLPPDERFRRLVHAYIQIAIEQADMIIVWRREEENLSKQNMSSVLRRGRQIENILQSVIEEGQKIGLYRGLTPRLVSLGIFGMCSFASQWSHRVDYSADQIASEFTLLLESGLFNDGSAINGRWPAAVSVNAALSGVTAQVAEIGAAATRLSTELQKAQSVLEMGVPKSTEKNKSRR